MRINSIVLLATACSIWSGCGDEDSKNKGSAAGRTKSGKTAPAAGNVVKKSLAGKAVVQNHGGPKPNNPPPHNPPPPSPPAMREESNLDKILKIRDDCLKSLDEQDCLVEDKNIDSLIAKAIEIIRKAHACSLEAGLLMEDEVSAGGVAYGLNAIKERVAEKLGILHHNAEGNPNARKQFYALTEEAKKYLVWEDIMKDAEKMKMAKEICLVFSALADNDVSRRLAIPDELRFQELMEAYIKSWRLSLYTVSEGVKKFVSVILRFHSMVDFVENADYLLLTQKKSLLISTAKLARNILSEIGNKESSETLEMYAHLAWPTFRDLFIKAYTGQVRGGNPILVSNKNKELIKKETQSLTALFNAFLESYFVNGQILVYNGFSDLIKSKLDPVVAKGTQELGKIDEKMADAKAKQAAIENLRNAPGKLIAELKLDP